MGAKQRDISASEFFTKNRHLLGFDNPAKALLTTVKEAVDNSLDACEEAGILPELTIDDRRFGPSGALPRRNEEGHLRSALPRHHRGQRPRDRQPQNPEDLRQAVVRLEVPRLRQSLTRDQMMLLVERAEWSSASPTAAWSTRW